ncbi:MAG: zinc ribbon domain-containing protein [Planctomycetota bacterium]
MPTYDYRCNNCGHEFEKFQSISASRLRKCPSCKKNSLERLIGMGGAVLFKGGGFYETDYRSESYKKGAEKDKPSESKTEGKSDSKAGSKSESKPDKKPSSKTESKPDKKSSAASAASK